MDWAGTEETEGRQTLGSGALPVPTCSRAVGWYPSREESRGRCHVAGCVRRLEVPADTQSWPPSCAQDHAGCMPCPSSVRNILEGDSEMFKFLTQVPLVKPGACDVGGAGLAVVAGTPD